MINRAVINQQTEAVRKYLDDDARAHIAAHGKWTLDRGKFETALESAGGVIVSVAGLADVTLGLSAMRDSLAELVEICRTKCSPTDEVILASGRTNHAALVDAVRVLDGGA